MNIRHSFFIFLVFVILAAFLSCNQQKSDWEGTIEEADGVRIVKNPIEPVYAEQVVTFIEDLSIKDEEEDDEFIFSEIFHITVSDEGLIYAFDMEASHILSFDQNGKFLRIIGRKGQGPGEFDRARLIYFSNGELIVTELNRMQYFSPEGELLRVIPTKTERMARARCDSQKNTVAICLGYDEHENLEYVLKKFDPDANLIKEMTRVPLKRTPGVSRVFSPAIYMAVNDQDFAILGYAEEYKLQVFDPAGELALVIRKDYSPVAVTAEDKNRIKERAGPEARIEFPKSHPPFVRFVHDEAGRLFVQTNEKCEGLNIYQHDVFDPDGKFITRVELKQYPVLFKNGKLYSLEEDEDGYKSIKRYQVNWTI